MKTFLLCLLALSACIPSNAQRIEFGIFAGAASYNGDLASKAFHPKITHASYGLTAGYEVLPRVMLRGALSYIRVGGADRFSESEALRARNLSFDSKVWEASLVAQYSFFNIEQTRFTPYIFGGIGAFHFNPYTYNETNTQIFLNSLGTEGQGLPGYGTRGLYKLNQFNIPFGGGVRYAINDRLQVGLEMNMRKLFTDYLDDVSGNYADPDDLLAVRGQQAVDISYRGDEIDGSPYPTKEVQRGNPKSKDWYYTAGVHITYNIGSSLFSGGGKSSRYGCPKVPL